MPSSLNSGVECLIAGSSYTDVEMLLKGTNLMHKNIFKCLKLLWSTTA